MVRFGQAILNGGELDGKRILKAETVKEMLADAEFLARRSNYGNVARVL
jgi:CubicO group peptidase (beta-lactamase class C family)